MVKKRGYFIYFILIALIIGVAGSVEFLAAENLNLKITGTVNNYSADFYLKTNANADNGVDTYDMVSPSDPGADVPIFYSNATGSNLVIDSVNTTARTANLIFNLPASQTGNLTFSWTALTGDYDATITYYGSDSSYTTAVGSANMRTSSSYSASISAKSSIYIQVVTSAYSAPTTDTNNSASPGGSGISTTSYWTKTIDNTKNENTNLINGYSQNLGIKERVRIEVSNEVHYVGVVGVASNSESAVIQIMSTPQNVTFYVGDEKKFDLNNNGYYDLNVKLNSIVNGKTNLSIKSINEKVIENISVNETDQEKPVADNNTQIPADNENSVLTFFISNIVIFIIGVVLLVVITIVIIRVIRIRRKSRMIGEIGKNN